MHLLREADMAIAYSINIYLLVICSHSFGHVPSKHSKQHWSFSMAPSVHTLTPQHWHVAPKAQGGGRDSPVGRHAPARVVWQCYEACSRSLQSGQLFLACTAVLHQYGPNIGTCSSRSQRCAPRCSGCEYGPHCIQFLQQWLG